MPNRTARRLRDALALALTALLAVGAFVVSSAEPCQAQQDTRKKAQSVFQEGQGLFQAGKFKEAGVKFLQAFELDPHPAILYNVARAFEEAGELVKSLQYYRQALGLNPSERVQDEIGAKIREIELFLRAQGVDVANLEATRWAPRGLLTVKTDPPGAQVFLNADPIGVTPMEDKPIPQGAYNVIVRKNGFKDVVREMTIIAGRTYVVDQPLPTEELVEAERHTGYIDVSAPRRGLMVFVDGEPRALTPAGALELEAGEHRISVEDFESKHNFPTWEGTVTVVEGQTAQVVANYPKPVIIEQEDTSFLSQTGWGLVVTGFGGAFLAGGVGFGALAWDTANSYKARRGEQGRAIYRDDAQTWALTADIFYGLGAAVVTVGALMIAFDDGSAEGPSAYDQLVDGGFLIHLAPAPDGRGALGGASVAF